ncbi:DUF192 domain-containing protein [Allomuricauda sp. NBRC 101325]|uniref:DUF192 domain-containing protein n=1 Tax=Allomuricauda sp. NBRC 101325 TaxID=1113758 RepID=UPI0024A2357E|nr:DUF192 domain-containing protein [Muricauda sp. NBRC 101325]GLU43991.1 hypothetical protein Musp01_16150 [Muricauda sp. NBRC 101325]
MFKNILILFLATLFLASCKSETKTSIKTETISFKKEGELQVIKLASDSTAVNFDIEIAETEYETQTGLMYRPSMKEKRGMLFIFPDVRMRSFYMKNTQFPLDIIYINGEQKIVSIQKDAEAYNEGSLPSEAPAKYVLEINAGLSDTHGFQAGDSISFSRN